MAEIYIVTTETGNKPYYAQKSGRNSALQFYETFKGRKALKAVKLKGKERYPRISVTKKVLTALSL